MHVYLEPAHVEEVLHESEDWEYVEISNEAALQAPASDDTCDEVDVHGQGNYLSRRPVDTSAQQSVNQTHLSRWPLSSPRQIPSLSPDFSRYV